MYRHTLTTKHPLSTLSWLGDTLVDWASAGTAYSLQGKISQLATYHFAYSFDSAIVSADGQYVFLYKRLGTKGLLLKNGEVLREINRSYYHAETYEYPAAFLTAPSGNTFLVHCPISYCRLDFEHVETGELATDSPNRKPSDIFHSRLEVSADGKHVVSKGWVWHPWDVVVLFDVEACLNDPTLLDEGLSIPNNTTETCSASFIDNDSLLVCGSQEEPLDDDVEAPIPPGHIAVWNFKNNQILKAVAVKEPFGNLIALNHTHCWDLFEYPKIINIHTGDVEEKVEDLRTGLQKSAIIHPVHQGIPLMAYNRVRQTLAIAHNHTIDMLSYRA